MDKKIIEGNKLIARFDTDEPEVLERDLLKAGTIECMHYHDDISWLWPVIEKIEAITNEDGDCLYNVIIEQCWCTILNVKTSVDISSIDADTKLEAIWLAIIEFLEWYNKNK